MAFSYFVVWYLKGNLIVGRCIEDKTRGSFSSSAKSVILVGNASWHYSSTSGSLNSLPNKGTDGLYLAHHPVTLQNHGVSLRLVGSCLSMLLLPKTTGCMLYPLLLDGVLIRRRATAGASASTSSAAPEPASSAHAAGHLAATAVAAALLTSPALLAAPATSTISAAKGTLSEYV